MKPLYTFVVDIVILPLLTHDFYVQITAANANLGSKFYYANLICRDNQDIRVKFLKEKAHITNRYIAIKQINFNNYNQSIIMRLHVLHVLLRRHCTDI